MEQYPGITTTLLHATIDLQVRDEAVTRASIPDPSQFNYSNVLAEQDRRETRILEAQDAIMLQMEAEHSRASGEDPVKREPVETIVLDDTPPPAHIQTSTPATPSTLPNWLKRKAPPVKTEAEETGTQPPPAQPRTSQNDGGATAAEGAAVARVSIPAITTSATVDNVAVPEANQTVDPPVRPGTEEAATEETRPGGGPEVEEIEPPTTAAGTMVFPKVRRCSDVDGAVLTKDPGALHRVRKEGGGLFWTGRRQVPSLCTVPGQEGQVFVGDADADTRNVPGSGISRIHAREPEGPETRESLRRRQQSS